ncbi:hypothetical protein [Serinicoccus sp. LYQ131]|uniref:hypothetical protein n=1 Tax=Serinicoccus sp. LYQ131 TaxID=3378797 RepID=UPI0038525E7A
MTAAQDLVIAHAFPPHSDPGAVVAAQRVRERGRPVDVIQNARGPEHLDLTLDHDLERIAGDLVRRRHEVDSPTLVEEWPGIARFTERGLQQALDWDRHGPGYQQLHSRADHVANHVLAARLRLLRPDLEWTAEFSGPLTHDARGKSRRSPVHPGALPDALAEGVRRAGFHPPESVNVFEWAETLAHALADRIVVSDARQRDRMVAAVTDEALAARVRERVVIAEQPVLPPAFYELGDPGHDLDPGRTHLGHLGDARSPRAMDVVLDALGALPPPARQGLCLHVVTPAHEDLREEVARRGLADVVRVVDLPRHLDLLALYRRMDVLLLSDPGTGDRTGAGPALPSAWGDHRGSGRPVWGLVEAGSALDAEPLDHRTPVGHVSAAVQLLSRLSALRD